MNQKVLRTIAVIILIGCGLCIALSIGVIIGSVARIGEKINEIESYVGTAEFFLHGAESHGENDPDVIEVYKPFWEAYDLLHEYYVDQPLDETDLMEGAIRGMIGALGDPHTRYADPDSFRSEQDSSAGHYQGIGATVDISGEYVEIVAPMSGSPAEKAGLRAKDLVIGLDGEDVTGIDPNDVLQNILGPEGSKVVLTIRRGEEEPFDVEIVRREIKIAMAEGKMLESGVAYIELTQFGDKTTEELRGALDDLLKQSPKGLILDLRNNGGGYLNTAVEVASEFLPEGVKVLSEIDGDGSATEFFTEKGQCHAQAVPMVVLINGGTASASEIVTGALRFHERAYVIGETSYGKGSVQIQPKLSNGGAVSVTIGRWYTPDGALIHGIGIEPDLTVELTEEDYENELDPQLDAAVSYLLGDLAESVQKEHNIKEGL